MRYFSRKRIVKIWRRWNPSLKTPHFQILEGVCLILLKNCRSFPIIDHLNVTCLVVRVILISNVFINVLIFSSQVILHVKFKVVHVDWYAFLSVSFCVSNVKSFLENTRCQQRLTSPIRWAQCLGEIFGRKLICQDPNLFVFPSHADVYTSNSVTPTSLISLLLLYPKTLGNGCFQFKSHSLLSCLPPIYHGFWHWSKASKNSIHTLTHITLSSLQSLSLLQCWLWVIPLCHMLQQSSFIMHPCQHCESPYDHMHLGCHKHVITQFRVCMFWTSSGVFLYQFEVPLKRRANFPWRSWTSTSQSQLFICN